MEFEPLGKRVPGKRSTSARGWLLLAACLSVGLGLSLYLRVTDQPPQLPERNSGVVSRGTELQLVSPLETVAEAPTRFVWEPIEGAELYRVWLLDVTEEVRWQTTATQTEVMIDEHVARSLHEHVHYRWRVEAFGLDDRLLGRSKTSEFVILRASQDDPVL